MHNTTKQNGTGKTTFVRMLAGVLKSDEEEAAIKAGDEDLAETLGYGRKHADERLCLFLWREIHWSGRVGKG